MANDGKRVAIIGAGLVGALNACFMAKRGFEVDLYEMRPDIRQEKRVKGRSINLALSSRGREALKRVGLEEKVIKNSIKMYARMIHDVNGKRRTIPYGRKDQHIMSIDRCLLNQVLLSAEKEERVSLHFEHKIEDCDFKTQTVLFQMKDGTKVWHCPDVIIGNDGAFSVVRNQMMKSVKLNYQQKYIPHGYMELTIPPTEQDEFAMEANYLHIWPRNEFMMIALPNLDKSFTATLFMPFKIFESIKTEEDLLAFFEEKFHDSIPLIGKKKLLHTFFSLSPLSLVSIKCEPYNIGGQVLIMGDAAHAMVPFFGQGMNAGFEDCILLSEFLDKYNNDFDKAFPAYTECRYIDAAAVCDLAIYNYMEMRALVNSSLFLIRKKVDNLLHYLFPKTWIPLYSMVSFTRIRYHECVKRKEWQDKVLNVTNKVIGLVILFGLVGAMKKFYWTMDVPFKTAFLTNSPGTLQ